MICKSLLLLIVLIQHFYYYRSEEVLANKEVYLKLAEQIELSLEKNVINVWFPRALDFINGGFYSEFSRNWNSSQSKGKFSVFQGRMTWITSIIAIHKQELREKFLLYVKHGLDYLNNVMWDQQYGGFYSILDDSGYIINNGSAGGLLRSRDKFLYGMSFCLYGATAAYMATNSSTALTLAQKAFNWIDSRAHDSINGGYFEILERDGKVINDSNYNYPTYKSMNTHIHLLESFTQLYQVWNNNTLRQRVEELLHIVRDIVSNKHGFINLFFTDDWKNTTDEDSYGHGVEITYLMLEAEEALGNGFNDTTETVGKSLVDHALEFGWDRTNGGFYQTGNNSGQYVTDTNKEWWSQFEGLNSLLIMHQKYGNQTNKYFNSFIQQWNCIKNNFTDNEFGGFYTMLGENENQSKGSIWKAAYHDGRALFNVNQRLITMANNI